MAKTDTIVLGGEKFTIEVMGLGQLKLALPIIVSIRLGDIPAEMPKVVDVLKIVLSEGYPDIDVDKIKATMMEVGLALNKVMQLNGFERKVQQPGEVPARAKRSTSRKSTAG